MQHLILLRDEVVRMIHESPQEFLDYLNRIIFDISDESNEMDAFGIDKGMIYVDGPSERDGSEIVYLWKNGSITPMFEMDIEGLEHLREIVEVKIKRMIIGHKERDEAAFSGLIAKCPDCGVLIGQEHVITCGIEICTECGRERIGCECKDHDRWKARWKGVRIKSPFSIDEAMPVRSGPRYLSI